MGNHVVLSLGSPNEFTTRRGGPSSDYLCECHTWLCRHRLHVGRIVFVRGLYVRGSLRYVDRFIIESKLRLSRRPAEFWLRSGVDFALCYEWNTAYLGFGAGIDYEFLQDFWAFDMLTGQWTRLADFPGPARKHPAMNYLEDVQEIHVGLGDGTEGNYQDWWSYSIADNAWTQLPDFPGTARHHPFYFAIGNDSYAGFGHSGTIERDWYKWDTSQQQWITEPNFESYSLGTEEDSNVPVTTEARVAGTQFTVSSSSPSSSLCHTNVAAGTTTSTTAIGRSSNTFPESIATTTTLGFILSGDGSDHRTMATGEFHVYDPSGGSTSPEEGMQKKYWRVLPSHPGQSRWAPGSFVLPGTQRVYMLGGYDRATRILHDDLWTIDVAPLFRSSVDGTSSSSSLVVEEEEEEEPIIITITDTTDDDNKLNAHSDVSDSSNGGSLTTDELKEEEIQNSYYENNYNSSSSSSSLPSWVSSIAILLVFISMPISWCVSFVLY